MRHTRHTREYVCEDCDRTIVVEHIDVDDLGYAAVVERELLFVSDSGELLAIEATILDHPEMIEW